MNVEFSFLNLLWLIYYTVLQKSVCLSTNSTAQQMERVGIRAVKQKPNVVFITYHSTVTTIQILSNAGQHLFSIMHFNLWEVIANAKNSIQNMLIKLITIH